MDRLFDIGAADVWLTPIVMKKNRLATKLSVLVREEKKEEAGKIILSETSSIGLRYSYIDRLEAQRKTIKVKTSLGTVKVKLAYHDGELVNVAPEYEDCAKIARTKKVPLKKVYQEALKQAFVQTDQS
ncbi:hypothetical protein LCGC14_0816820 [marine sediment metagenome]|uniref:TIGR00299 family protein n=1 Tax=marine sediment metagenome TaxID=412755 RepID=A0A0F9Q5D5_9ZZZZ